MDRLLRQSMASPVPSLPANFDRRVVRAANRNSELLGRVRWRLLAGYALVSAATSLVVMHAAGLNWLPIAGIVAPLTLLATVYSARQATQLRTHSEHPESSR